MSLDARRYPLSLFFSVIGSLILLFTVFTLLNMVAKQLLFDPAGLVNAGTDPFVLKSIGLTLYASSLATFLTMIFGTPLAYVLARHDFRGKNLIESIIDVPVIIPHSVAGIALYVLLMSRSPVGQLFAGIGVVFEDHLAGIVAAMLFVSSSLFINAAREGFQSVDPRLERVARTLGASQRQAFFRITLPLAARHLLSGAILSWARGISEFGAVVMIAFYPMIAPVLIYYRFTTTGLRGSQPIAVLLIIICLTVFIALRVYSRRWERK
ncbi:ABC transporter permease [Candidatus Bathyarchaeota archaeon]|nr:ABC transporter permease [Candidatus Bathyarchaeota archaeon]